MEIERYLSSLVKRAAAHRRAVRERRAELAGGETSVENAAAAERAATAALDGGAAKGSAADSRERLRATFAKLLGDFADEERLTEPRLLERVRCDGYTRERIELATVDGLRMPVYVLLPDRKGGQGNQDNQDNQDNQGAQDNHDNQGNQDNQSSQHAQNAVSRPLPAVIALHGHGYGSREIVGLEPDGSQRAGDPGLHKDFAVSLVREGYVVLAPELIGFGDRRLAADKAEKPGQNSCFALAAHLLLVGKTLAGLRVRETLRAVDYARERPCVDPDRIAVMGISGGGLVAGFAAALDLRIRHAVISGYASLFAESILDRNHCLDNYIPGILREAELPELLGLIAPRGLFVESGVADRVFPRAAAEKAYRELLGLYAEAGAPDALGADFFEGGHEIHGGPAFAWLRGRLQALSATEEENEDERSADV